MNIRINQYSGIYRLEATQFLYLSLADAWDFFSSPENLQAITPDNIGFEMTSGGNGKAYPGKIITYKISLIPFYKTNWVTEITEVEKQQFFVDEQRLGPYALWHHEHHFKEVENGILMKDLVSYKLPFGIIGRWVAGKIIRKKLMAIFSYRYKMLDEKFSNV